MSEKQQPNAEKMKVLQAVISKIEKDFGKGSIMYMKEAVEENHQFAKLTYGQPYRGFESPSHRK